MLQVNLNNAVDERNWSLGTISIFRHGKSEANQLGEQWDEEHDLSLFTSKVLSTHDSIWDLTPQGVLQAEALRDWMQEHVGTGTHYFSSPFPRAIRTSLIASGNVWPKIIPSLREQDWGEFSRTNPLEIPDQRADYGQKSKYDAYIRPPNGESLADVYHRLEAFSKMLTSILTDIPSANVWVSCHNGVRRALLFHLRNWPLTLLPKATGPDWDNNNCQVAVFSSDTSGQLTRMINVSPAILTIQSSITSLIPACQE